MSDEHLREDELASAYLDGEATPAEIAEVEASDALLARVEEFRALRDAVAEPVAPLPQDRQDDLIGAALDAALGAAEAEEAARAEAKVVPLRRPQRLLLAMAAVVVLLAAVVGTGLIASRGGDDFDESATLATAMPESAAGTDTADDAAPAEEEPMAAMDITTADEATAEEEPMADMEMAAEAPMADDDAMADMEMAAEAPMAEEERRSESAEAMEATEAAAAATAEAAAAEEDAPAATTTIAAATTTDGAPADDSLDDSSEQVVDLGTLESLDPLLEDVGARWSAAVEDGAMADSGACAETVQEQALNLGSETIRAFVVTVGSEDPVTFDARFARRDDGTAVVVYAAPPDCEVGIHDLPDS